MSKVQGENMNTRKPEYYEYMIVENSAILESEWQIVGVYGGLVFKWMVFRRHMQEESIQEKDVE